MHQGLAVRGHDGSFLILDRVGSVDVVIGVRSHTGKVLSVYLMEPDIEKVVEFLSRKAIRKARITWERANGTNRAMPLRLASSNCHR